MKKFILNSILLLFLFNSYSQQKNNDGKFWTGNLEYKFVPSIAEQLKDGSFIPAVKNPEVKEIYDKRLKSNKVILGKGLPNGMDPLVTNNKQTYLTKQTREPSLVFETLTDQTNGCPSDPTGAIGVDYYLAAWNPAFRIYDRSGNPVIPAASLSNLLGSNFGDPIAFYDAEADRYVITAMAQGLLQLAISQTGDPVSDGWHTFSIQTPGTSGLPDYPKYSIWSDGYYVSVNGNANDFYVLERDKIINGDQSASIQGSTVPGMATGNFASPFFF